MDARMAFKRGAEKAKVLLGARLSGVQRAGRRCKMQSEAEDPCWGQIMFDCG